MKILTVSGPPSCGKTSVILHLLEGLRNSGTDAGVIKFDCLSAYDELRYQKAGVPVLTGISANMCPDHYYISNIEEGVTWAREKGLGMLVSESAGLCNRCSPHIRDVLAVCVIDCLSGSDTPRKIGPMLRFADVVVITKGDIVSQAEREAKRGDISISALRILGGHDKLGRAETLDITARAGETVAVVGPTGAGKSCLLADIECLAQGDTPTGRRVLVNGEAPSDELRFSMDSRPVAQLSQNMNFIMDLTVGEFLHEHALSRMAPDDVIKDIFACANDLAGEEFALDTNVTRLSGGQSRALMIADTLLLSRSPILLIDEIENAGIDRRRAVRLFRETGKIIFLSTHDPLLALTVDRRMVVRGGAVQSVIESGGSESGAVSGLEKIDAALSRLRDEIRAGGRIGGGLEDWL